MNRKPGATPGVYALALTAGFSAGGALAADGFDTLSHALLGGTPGVDLRLRTEHVDNEGPQPRDSTATTLRTRLSYTTGKWNAFDIGVDFENTSALDKLDYNNTLPGGQADRPPVADPTGSELNQAWLRYSGIPGTTLQAGRLRYALDNRRFVGNVAWRQSEQTFDGIALVNKSLPGSELTYAYFHNANTITFLNVPMKAHLANASYVPAPWLKATLYGYFLDFTMAPASVNALRQDTQTLGLRAAGSFALNETLKLVYAAEYALQSDHADAPDAVDAAYALAEVGAALPLLTVKLGYEELASNNGLYAAQTPLATLHAFNGWADLFLTTPATGLRDTYVHASGAIAQLGWMARYHQFAADFGGADYGEEFDAQLTLPLSKQLSALAKYAHYNADAFASDTQKLWLQIEFKF